MNLRDSIRASSRWLLFLPLAGAVACNPAAALQEDKLVHADLFSPEAEIMSAGYGFEGIIGVEGGEAEVRAAGGAWNKVTCTNGAEPQRRVLTSSVEPNGNLDVTRADAMPIVFSWPYLPSTLAPTDFSVVLNDGSKVTPAFATIMPNYEYNERQVAVLFGEFGNRLRPDEAGSLHPVRVDVVADDEPLMLVGPKGPVSAVGLSKESTNPYVAGPGLVAAKLSRFSTEGEGGPEVVEGPFPNDGVALYGSAAKFRLRVYTSGGFSPDGVRGLRPDEFEHFFRLHAKAPDGSDVLLEETGVDHAVDQGVIRIVGLADLGRAASGEVVYDDCYVEDWDNYIDIVLDGDEAAMRSITGVEIPASGSYGAFFNPGGPGNSPTEGVRYTAPGLPQLQPVTLALDDPMTVSYEE
ncbi:phospholipase [Polyangium spumosum]|uniref:Phospholipase n=1 Tax=Polyangium spumosum TaxID=889282 RepID=A0A6N7PP38_9BACT|nr:phospholipase [Polyangium spumosum]MRG93699.1 phospholipase [Polyangium spumosum]